MSHTHQLAFVGKKADLEKKDERRRKELQRMSRETDDFGFSMVDETELRNQEYEKELEDKLQTVDSTASDYKKRLIQTRQLVMPLLQGLTRDPHKAGLLWPKRAEKVKALIRELDKIAGDMR